MRGQIQAVCFIQLQTIAIRCCLGLNILSHKTANPRAIVDWVGQNFGGDITIVSTRH